MIGRLRGQLWNWLPAFLEIAETGSVVAASRSLHLTPAAVSRTLRLLEGELGEPVFNRVGRSLVLNERGNSLRDAMRTAVATVERGLTASLADPFSGSLRVSSLGVLTQQLVMPSLIALKADHAGLLPEHRNLRPAEAADALVRGELDVAFYYEERAMPGAVVERLGEIRTSVYCGRGHPLFSRKRVTSKMVLDYAFSVPQVGDSGLVMDGWPTDLPRTIGMRITLLSSNLAICLSGSLLTVLPDMTANEHRARGDLRRLPTRALPAIEVLVARPASGLPRGAARALIDNVRSRLTAVPRLACKGG